MSQLWKSRTTNSMRLFAGVKGVHIYYGRIQASVVESMFKWTHTRGEAGHNVAALEVAHHKQREVVRGGPALRDDGVHRAVLERGLKKQ